MTEGPVEREGETPVEAARRRVCALFDVSRAAGSPRGTRDAALISVLFGAKVGRRRAVRLRRSAYDEGAGLLDPRRLLPTAGPGRCRDGGLGGTGAGEGVGSAATRRATAGARRVLRDWVEIRGEAAGPLFCRLTAGVPAPGRRLAPRSVEEALARRAREASLEAVGARSIRELYESPWWRLARPR